MLVPILVNLFGLDLFKGTFSNTLVDSANVLLSSMFIIYIYLSMANIAK